MSIKIFEYFTRDPDATPKRMFGNVPFSFDGQKAELTVIWEGEKLTFNCWSFEMFQNEIRIWEKVA